MIILSLHKSRFCLSVSEVKLKKRFSHQNLRNFLNGHKLFPMATTYFVVEKQYLVTHVRYIGTRWQPATRSTSCKKTETTVPSCLLWESSTSQSTWNSKIQPSDHYKQNVNITFNQTIKLLRNETTCKRDLEGHLYKLFFRASFAATLDTILRIAERFLGNFTTS